MFEDYTILYDDYINQPRPMHSKNQQQTINLSPVPNIWSISVNN